MRLVHWPALLAVCGTALLAPGSPASACGCGAIHGPVVARGLSPRGTPWQIRAMLNEHRALRVDFSFGAPGYANAGYSELLRYPIPKRFTFTASPGSGLDPFGERDVSGIATRQVALVVIALSDGSSVVTRPRLARSGAYRRNRWIRRLRFYDAFLTPSAEPLWATARDVRGRDVGRLSLGG